MGGKNVKNTIVEWVLDSVAPHLCFGCGKTGTPLCIDCKYNIIHDPFLGCIMCGRVSSRGVCEHHRGAIERAFVVSTRQDTLEAITSAYKFNQVKRAARELALLLHYYLPLFPGLVHVVPVPTARSHVRQRGYDHVLLIARELCVLRGWTLELILERTRTATQHTASRTERIAQAPTTYRLVQGSTLTPNNPYLLIDDIITTGSTIQAAATELVRSGGRVWAAALAYQPLD